MNVTFENEVVNVQQFIELYITDVANVAFKLMIIALIVMIIINKILPNFNFAKFFYFNALQIIVLFFKIVVCIQLFKYVFFYNFEKHIYIYEFPQKMLISSLFVEVLAFYEILVGIIDIIKIFIDYCLTIQSELKGN